MKFSEKSEPESEPGIPEPGTLDLKSMAILS
jgi:hypothetical protein